VTRFEALDPEMCGVLCWSFFRAYRDDYRPVPFSTHFVRHIEGWYAQKHPDEDFAGEVGDTRGQFEQR